MPSSHLFDDVRMSATLGSQWGVIMTEQEAQQLSSILQEIRDNQKLQLDHQAEALALQREHHALIQRQTERHERIQDPLCPAPHRHPLIVYVSWLIFR